MSSVWKYGPVGALLAYFAACAPVKFSAMPEPPCGGNGVSCIQKCTGPSCVRNYTVEKTIGQPLVDILIVDDNSGSMSPHQSKMASAFAGFIGQLDGANLDYRIAITTTDVSNKYSPGGMNAANGPGPYNGQGAFQDGNLVPFAPSMNFLASTDANRDALFISTVTRQETIHCESSGFRECPSNDERGIFALNLALDLSVNQYVRPAAHFAFIILSNEDERGLSDPRSVMGANDQALLDAYPLEANDLPDTFISKFKTLFPAKTLSVHSIIIKPGDTACLAAQTHSARSIRGKEGFSYASLSQSTGGVIASICDANYTGSLSAIGSSIQSQAISLPFQCRPTGDVYTLKFSPQPATTPTSSADWSKMQLNISSVPPGTKITLTYECAVK